MKAKSPTEEMDFENYSVEKKRALNIRSQIAHIKSSGWVQNLKYLVQELGSTEEDANSDTGLFPNKEKATVTQSFKMMIAPLPPRITQTPAAPDVEQLQVEAEPEELQAEAQAEPEELQAEVETDSDLSPEEKEAEALLATQMVDLPKTPPPLYSGEIPDFNDTEARELRITFSGVELKSYFGERSLLEVSLLPKDDDYLLYSLNTPLWQEFELRAQGQLTDLLKLAKSAKSKKQEAFKARFNKKK